MFWVYVLVLSLRISQVDMLSYTPTIGFVIIGTISAVCTFFDFAGLREKHAESASRYDEIAIDAETEMCKPRANRIACDLFLSRMELRMTNLERYRPGL